MRTALAKIAAVLASQGQLVLKVPTSEGWFYRTALALAGIVPPLARNAVNRLWLRGYEVRHRVYFSRRSLTMLLRSAGFRVVARTYLREVALSNALQRIRVDRTIPALQYPLILALTAAILMVEALTRRTDSSLFICAKVSA